MTSIFLSHNHLDRPFARRLAQDLMASGVRVWLDEAEIQVGESLLLKIQSGISEMDFIGAVLSPNSVASPWVTQELLMAMNLEITTRTPRVLPIYYQNCDLPLFLAHKRYADFREPNRYRRALAEILQTLRPSAPLQRLTGKEAARLVKNTQHPRGELCGLSQQGITQQYIGAMIMESRDWLLADARTGRSAVWVVDYYDSAARMMRSFGFYDGRITAFPELHVMGDEPQPLNINYVDSDIAVARAVLHAKGRGKIPDEDDYFLLTRLRYSNARGFVWLAMFMDITLTKTVYVVTIDASSAEIVDEAPAHKERNSMTPNSDQELLREVRRTAPVFADYGLLARNAFSRSLRTGGLANIDPEVAVEMVADYEERIENITNRKILERLAELGREAELERMADEDIDLHAYFTHAIPGYEGFLNEATQAAVSELLTGKRV